MLHLSKLSVAIDKKPLLEKITLSVNKGEVHALLGQNGSGKSTLAHTLMGNPLYQITSGMIRYNHHDLKSYSVDQRSRLGIFLSFQNPHDIPGVCTFQFLKQAYDAQRETSVDASTFSCLLNDALTTVGLDTLYAYRDINVGFSGGEKKLLEMVALILLNPTLIILDEIDSGLDMQATIRVCTILKKIRDRQPQTSFIIISHHQNILQTIIPDAVHIMHKGTLIHSDNRQVLNAIKQSGYEQFYQK